MDFNKINTIIFETLETLASIETSKVSMLDTSDKYSSFPFLRFRFKGKNKDDIIYYEIQNIINSFQGKLKWEMTTIDESKNYVISPKITDANILVSSKEKKDKFIDEFGFDIYMKIIDDCINDIPELAKAIGSLKT